MPHSEMVCDIILNLVKESAVLTHEALSVRFSADVFISILHLHAN